MTAAGFAVELARLLVVAARPADDASGNCSRFGQEGNRLHANSAVPMALEKQAGAALYTAVDLFQLEGPASGRRQGSGAERARQEFGRGRLEEISA